MQGTRETYYQPISYAYYLEVPIGDDISDTDPRLVNLDKLQWVLVRTEMRGEIKYKKGMYIYEAMKKI